MAFTGNEIHDITLADAAKLTANFRASIISNPDKTKGMYYSKADIQALLNQTGSIGMRAYYGLTVAGAKELVLVGVKTNEDDLCNGLILDKAVKCPPVCGAANPLNGAVTA